MKRFEHGGDVGAFAARCGCAPGDVIDLSSNINFMTPEVDLGGTVLNAYPDYALLTRALADRYGVRPDEIELFNGGSSAIFSLMRALPHPLCTIYAPAYGEYKKAAELCGKKVALINRFEGTEQDVTPGSLVVFVNPSTPDGRYYEIDALMERWREKHCTVIIDESFLEFCGGESATRHLQTYDKLYVLKSQTKFYGCAGVRAGIVLSRAENIRTLREKEPLWKLSAFDASFLIGALGDEPFRTETLKRNAEAKSRLASILDASGLFECRFESDANFFLVRLATMDAQTFQERLLPHRIMVRNCSNFDFLDDSYGRIAVKNMEALERFEKALSEILLSRERVQ
jgi:threonine-phosphate decarboxylase